VSNSSSRQLSTRERIDNPRKGVGRDNHLPYWWLMPRKGKEFRRKG